MTIALCVGAFVPVIWPGLGMALRPSLPLMIAVFLVNAFAQLDLSHARQNLTRPIRLLSATGWAIFVVPAAVLELLWKGVHTGPLQTPTGTIPASNKPIEMPACQVVRVEGDKVKSASHYFDMLTMLTQIGATGAVKTAA
ncbi:ester cyclase [Bradyrhizobium sp. McL0615]|uniref:ester cyclase n=1 Tax=Bradyrhizobium sp. McL0615 TaxID=3415673 RepID=UPI003CEB3E3B